MKKYLVLLMVATMALCSGCKDEVRDWTDGTEYVAEDNTNTNISEVWVQDGLLETRVYTVVDPVTGVNYVIYGDYRTGGGITPRLNEDGTLFISEVTDGEV